MNTIILKRQFQQLSAFGRRNIGFIPVSFQKVTDPIQQLFLDKIREYRKKSGGNKLVDVTPETEQEMKKELDKLARSYGGKPSEMDAFPTFKYEDPVIEDVNK
uniref:Uncharacterized protein n=1 Tax=Cuerna arida TaxID=1464854 RepID=A0A1B6H4V7_9HEMI